MTGGTRPVLAQSHGLGESMCSFEHRLRSVCGRNLWLRRQIGGFEGSHQLRLIRRGLRLPVVPASLSGGTLRVRPRDSLLFLLSLEKRCGASAWQSNPACEWTAFLKSAHGRFGSHRAPGTQFDGERVGDFTPRSMRTP